MIHYAVIAAGVVILSIVLVIGFNLNTGMIDPSSAKGAVAFARPAAPVQTILQEKLVRPTISIRPETMCSGSLSACANGCTDTQTDPDNCGACGTVCPKNPYSDRTCSAGKCASSCLHGYMDCNQNTADGCEIYVENDDNNCGHCGNVCDTGSSCSAYACRKPLVSGGGGYETISPPAGQLKY